MIAVLPMDHGKQHLQEIHSVEPPAGFLLAGTDLTGLCGRTLNNTNMLKYLNMSPIMTRVQKAATLKAPLGDS